MTGRIGQHFCSRRSGLLGIRMRQFWALILLILFWTECTSSHFDYLFYGKSQISYLKESRICGQNSCCETVSGSVLIQPRFDSPISDVNGSLLNGRLLVKLAPSGCHQLPTGVIASDDSLKRYLTGLVQQSTADITNKAVTQELVLDVGVPTATIPPWLSSDARHAHLYSAEVANGLITSFMSLLKSSREWSYDWHVNELIVTITTGK